MAHRIACAPDDLFYRSAALCPLPSGICIPAASSRAFLYEIPFIARPCTDVNNVLPSPLPPELSRVNEDGPCLNDRIFVVHAISFRSRTTDFRRRESRKLRRLRLLRSQLTFNHVETHLAVGTRAMFQNSRIIVIRFQIRAISRAFVRGPLISVVGSQGNLKG